MYIFIELDEQELQGNPYIEKSIPIHMRIGMLNDCYLPFYLFAPFVLSKSPFSLLFS